MPALYTSVSFQTAWLEARQAFVFKPRPMVLRAKVDCSDIVDLTRQATLARYGFAEADLACAWEAMAYRGERPPSWSVADALVRAGKAGIRVLSFAAGATRDDVDVVFWTWADRPPHQVVVVDDFGRLSQSEDSRR